MSLTYANYLNLDDLLTLQQPLSDDPEHDEMLFIITHQVYELWFKQVIHEFDGFQLMLSDNQLVSALRNLKRILHILKVLVAQMDIIETLSPLSFRSFRDRLESASGFQSVQFREIEFMLGKRNTTAFSHYQEGTPAYERLKSLWREPCVWDSFLQYINGNDYFIPESVLCRDVTRSIEPNEAVQKTLMKIYKSESTLTLLCEHLVDLDEGLMEWRYRHVKMVERTIGNKLGTGGSNGVAYLYKTLHVRFFPDLWAIRNAL